MIKLIGQETGKVYAEGHIQDCYRELLKKYPTNKKHPFHINKGQNVTQIYPEPLLVVKK
ncbi:hypothetical protein [Oceanobacillus profundus]|uniref:hypothetical protein n=1 Tax=Oceanobacillus TaxID=182709 RepID=UPI0026E3328B|nr:hypothetical protein [Oceanobacillus profundus]MDO6448116.1 hypothetical protein [Oceanobacillus profundus]